MRHQHAPDSLIDTIAQQTQASPLRSELWEQVLEEAEVPGREIIVRALRDGVPLSLDRPVTSRIQVPNHSLLYLDLQRVTQAIEEEVVAGRYVKLPPDTDTSQLNVSAMGVAPRFKSFEARRAFEKFSNQVRSSLKHAALDDFEGRTVSDGPGLDALGDFHGEVKWRVIHDLTHPTGNNVNSFVESPYFQLPTAVDFARKLARGAYIWKGDIDKAFRNVPVHKRDWPLLAFHVNGVLYVDTRLPFGHALSPYYFVNLVGRPILYVAARRGATLLGALSSYVDDFFGGCDTYEKSVDQMQTWLQVCADLGVPVSQAKTFLPAQVVEILGFIIDTNNMSLTVDPERIQDILSEMAHFEGRGTVKRRDLERLAGKMTFVCSVVPGGRTFMRETLNMIRKLRSGAHWAHLSSGFRRDLEWWRKFAEKWNGVEVIPPPVSIPWTWLTSDASGEHGLGVFCCGAGLHIPLPAGLLQKLIQTDTDLIIAELELIAAVLLVAFSAPLLQGEHLLLGIDNQVAISWIDSGTSRRPRAMRALRLLWRLQATYRVHLSTRYIQSEKNVLADSASRCNTDRFSQASANWLRTNHLSLRKYGINQDGRASLVTTPYGSTGGATGILAKYLVEGHDKCLSGEEDEVAGLCSTISAFASRFVSQEYHRLRHVPGDHGEERDRTVRVQLPQGLCRLLGSSDVLYISRSPEPSTASRSSAVLAGSGAETWKTSRQSGAMHFGPSENPQPGRLQRPEELELADGGSRCDDRLLGVSKTGSSHPQKTRKTSNRLDSTRHAGERPVPPYHGPSIKDHPIWRETAQDRGPLATRPRVVPVSSISPMDISFATPVLPDSIVRAICEQRGNADVQSVSGAPEWNHTTSCEPHWPLLSSRVRSTGIHTRSSNMASDASRRLEDIGSCNVVRGGRPDPKPPWRDLGLPPMIHE